MRLLCSPGRTRDCSMPVRRRRATVSSFAPTRGGDGVRPVAVTEGGPPVPMRRRGYRALGGSASGGRRGARPGGGWRGGSCGGGTGRRMAVRRLWPAALIPWLPVVFACIRHRQRHNLPFLREVMALAVVDALLRGDCEAAGRLRGCREVMALPVRDGSPLSRSPDRTEPEPSLSRASASQLLQPQNLGSTDPSALSSSMNSFTSGEWSSSSSFLMFSSSLFSVRTARK